MNKILEEVTGAKSIGIGGHIRPDGDCVGSCMGMYLYLKKVLPEDTVIEVCLDEPADIFGCIKDIDVIRQYPRRQAYDVFICTDCGPDRLGDRLPGYEKAKKTINVDHHISNKGSSDVNYIFPEASSASELVYELMDKEYVDADIAKAIYIGIIHDTGVLQYSNAVPKTLRYVAELLEYGFDHTAIIDETFYQKTFIQNQMMGKALSESELFMDGRCIVTGVDLATMQEKNLTSKDLDGIVSQLRYTKGVEVAMFMYELEPDTWKISLRGNKDVPLNKVAEHFGGGGHMKAAGFTVSGSRQSVYESVAAKLAELM